VRLSALAGFISLSLLSSLHKPGNPARWRGPALAAFGLLSLALIALIYHQSFFGRWFLSQALTPDRILPIVGLGFAFGLVSQRIFFTALVLLIVGIFAGFASYDRVIFVLYSVWHAPSHFSMTGPISCLAAGLTLLPGERTRAWLLPMAAFVAGSMLAIAIFLNDPSFREPLFICSPLVVAFWVIAAVSLTVRAFRHKWLVICGRILGSWTVAIGVLYGGASTALIVKQTLPSRIIPRAFSQGGGEFNPPVESGNGWEDKTARDPTGRTPGKFDLPPPYTDPPIE